MKPVAVAAIVLAGLLAMVVGIPVIAIATGAGNQIVSVGPSAAALADIPPGLLITYQAGAATCPGLDWSVLAAVGKIETDHGRSTLPGVSSGTNSAGAAGPMQFLAATWAAYAVDGDHDGVKDIYDSDDAIYTAAAYLCANGAGTGPQGLHDALWAYNRAEWYVQDVLSQTALYRTAGGLGATGNVQAVLGYAQAQLGKPYVWGGEGPDGFDCSGLTMQAYAQIGIRLPHFAASQYLMASQPLARPAELAPGDLLFWATNPADPTTIHHEAIYVGNGQMIEAPRTGLLLRLVPARLDSAEYVGATRPITDPGYQS